MQPHVIQIDDWEADETWGLAYPEGARAKKLLLSPSNTCWSGIKPSWRYLFKQSDKKYPQQFWCEIISYQIGLMLDIPVPPAFAAFDSKTGQCAALIEWFYKEGEVQFIPAGNFFQQRYPSFDRKKGSEHNWGDAIALGEVLIGEACWEEFADMALFDTLIGNTDRHQDNWGFLINFKQFEVDREEADFPQIISRFTPWFDNGTSLGNERFPDRALSWSTDRLNKYIDDGCHHMRYDVDNLVRIPHMMLLSQIQIIPEWKQRLSTKMEQFDLEKIVQIMQTLRKFELPIQLDQPRIEWIHKLLRQREARIREILK